MDWWEWRVIREHFARTLETVRDERRMPQVAIAESGGIRQNLVSRLLKNRKRGPSVETFLRALKGLGVKPSEFFAALEDDTPSARRAASDALPPALTMSSLADQEAAASDHEIARLLTRLIVKTMERTAAKQTRRPPPKPDLKPKK